MNTDAPSASKTGVPRADAGSCVIYLNNRYHDPMTGQFISVDPLVTTTGEPYIYGAANPATYSDPSGLDADTSSTIQYRSFGYCIGGDGRCAGESVRRLYTRFRNTARAQAIHATLDVAYQQDWGKADGYVSSKDLEYGAQPGGVGVLFLLGGDPEAAGVVARVAAAFVGSDEWAALTGDKPGVGAVGLFGNVCVGTCVSAGLLGGDGRVLPYISLGGVGMSASAGVVTASQDACAQRGWSVGADAGELIVGGGSVAADPLPNSSGQLWDFDQGNSQLRLGLGGGFPVSGGHSYTWVPWGC